MTEEDLKEFLDANKAEIQAQVKQRLIEGLLANHSWTMRDQISTVVSDFMKEEIIPEVKKHLISEKSTILEAAIASTAEIGDMLTKAMVANAAKNITGNNYGFNDLLKGIFAR